MRVKVYWNVRKRVWSLLNLRGELIGHRSQLELDQVVPKVSEAGRQRVLRTKRKVVHAFLIGELIECDNPPEPYDRGLRYNPYEHEGFVIRDHEDVRVENITRARCHPNGRVTYKE